MACFASSSFPSLKSTRPAKVVKPPATRPRKDLTSQIC
jgi:hypothetical protein